MPLIALLLVLVSAPQPHAEQGPPPPTEQQDSTAGPLAGPAVQVAVVQQPAAQQAPSEQGHNGATVWAIGWPVLGVLLTALGVLLRALIFWVQRRTNRLRDRAYLGVVGVWLHYPLVGPPVGWIRVENGGKTRAHQIRASLWVHVGAKTFAGRQPPPANRETDGLPLGPGAASDMVVPVENRSEDAIVGEHTRSAPTFVYGVITYHDGFRGNRSTTFRWSGVSHLSYIGDYPEIVELSRDNEGNASS